MTVQQLRERLDRMNPDADVFFRKGRTLNAVTIVRANSHADWIIELTNEESDLRR